MPIVVAVGAPFSGAWLSASAAMGNVAGAEQA